MSILYITIKDLTQMMRDRKTFLFFLIMPIGFTLLFGFAFSGAGSGASDERLPVGFLDQDHSALSQQLETLLASSTVIRLESDADQEAGELEKSVRENDLAAALIIPAGYGESQDTDIPLKLTVLSSSAESAALSAQTEISNAASRLMSAVNVARLVANGSEVAFDEAMAAWQNPPVRLLIQQSGMPVKESNATPVSAFAHSAPGMMLQFAIAGLLTCAQVIVTERKSRCLQRMLTTKASRIEVLSGHYLAVFSMIFGQFIILILFGQLFLKLDYVQQPVATLLLAFTSALCISALGLLIGALSKGEEQAIAFSLILMFVFSGLGGAWVPLDITGPTFQTIGHATPVAWAMDGFEGILMRGSNLGDVFLPMAALMGYAVLFFTLAVWRFKFE